MTVATAAVSNFSEGSGASDSLAVRARRTRTAARSLAIQPIETRNGALGAIAEALADQKDAILAANAEDCRVAQGDGISSALYGRLKLTDSKYDGVIAGVRDLAKLADPLGAVQIHRELDDGLVLKRLTCPLGVLGVIFEARPDAVVQIATLAIKSGNGVILKGGREAVRSCTALVAAIHQGLEAVGIDANAVQLLTTRQETLELLHLDQDVDLIIPRGSNSFVRYVQDNTRIPVLGHADGICHIYVDESADIAKTVTLAVDAKIQYPSACNAVETILVHRGIASAFLPAAGKALTEKGVEVRGDETALGILQEAGVKAIAAAEEDWSTEYSDLVVSIAVVDHLDQALAHIAEYGSGHTEAIATENHTIADRFLAEVDAAGVFHNCSTRFSDGFRYGFGAEVGISTSRLAPRGPVGLEGLVTYKYQLVGNGHIAATYSGADAKAFTHRDRPLT
ncbi:MAG: glutamate-5-semialdehyde dehydrogenase [Cyanobacteria bacterium P01_F01_bin.153]